jgi:hypothetical protein
MDHLAVDVQDKGHERIVGIRALGGSARSMQLFVGERADPRHPFFVGFVELSQRGRRIGGVRPALVVGGRPVEVRVVAHGKHADDDVREAPRDRGERCRFGRRVVEVDRAVGMHGPAVRHRFPEVLVVGQPVESRPQLVGPVKFQLLGELFGDHFVGCLRAHDTNLSST